MAADPLATPGGGGDPASAALFGGGYPMRWRLPDSVALPHHRRGRIPTCREPLGGGSPIRWRFPTVRKAEPRAAASGWVAVTRFGGDSPPFEGVATPPTDGKRLTIGQPPPMRELAPAGTWTDSFMAANPLRAPAGGSRLGEPFGGSYPNRWRFPTVEGAGSRPAASRWVAVTRFGGTSPPFEGLNPGLPRAVGWQLPDSVTFPYRSRGLNPHLPTENASPSGNRHPCAS
jgi:hypothetical protein